MTTSAHAPKIDGIDGLELIGRGGFALVYRGHQSAFRRDVAVKVLQGSDVADEDRRRFERECQAMGALSDHPAIVTLYSAGLTDQHQLYLVMEFVPGGSLQEEIEANGPMDWRTVVELGARLCGALEAAHHSGVLHRDIKPANVLQSRYGAQLSDFGIARLAGGHETRSGVITASIAYAPPEVLDGDPPTRQSDVYSLASTLYTALHGRSAFVRDTDDSILPQIRRVLTESPYDLRLEGVPDRVMSVIEGAMSKLPGDRPESAAEFESALRALLIEPSAPTARPPTVPTSTPQGQPAPPTTPERVAADIPPPIVAQPDPPRQLEPVQYAQAPTPSRSRARGILLAVICVAVLAALVVGGIVLVARPDKQPQAEDPTTATTIDSATATTTESTATSATDATATTVLRNAPVNDTVVDTATITGLSPIGSSTVTGDDDDFGSAAAVISALAAGSQPGRYYAFETYSPSSADADDERLPGVFELDVDLGGGALAAGDVSFVSAHEVTGPDSAPYGAELDLEGFTALADGTFVLVSEHESGKPSEVFIDQLGPDFAWQQRLDVPEWYLPVDDEGAGFKAVTVRPGNPGTILVATEIPVPGDRDPDDPSGEKIVRILELDVATGRAVAEWGYPLEAIPDDVLAENPNLENTFVEMIAVDADTLIVLERTKATGVSELLYSVVDLDSGVVPSAEPPPRLDKRILLDGRSAGAAGNTGLQSFALGPVLDDGRSTLIVASDSAVRDEPTLIVAIAIDTES